MPQNYLKFREKNGTIRVLLQEKTTKGRILPANRSQLKLLMRDALADPLPFTVHGAFYKIVVPY